MKPFGILLLLILSGCDSLEVVMEDLDQHEANQALVILRKANISAQKEGHSVKKSTVYQIKVKKSQADDALNILVANHLPPQKSIGLKEVFPPGSSALIPSKSDEMARFIMASQGEAESLLKIVPGILDARVVFSFQQEPSNEKKSASVAIIYSKEENNAPPLSDLEVKVLLSASISGLLPENVFVVQKMNKGFAPALTIENELLEAKDAQWHMLALTLLALMVASYSAFRLLWQKKRS